MANRVIPPHRRDPDDSHDSQYYRRGVDDIRNVITSTTEPLSAEPGTLWYNPEGVPEYGVDIGISKDDADSFYASKVVETRVARVDPGEYAGAVGESLAQGPDGPAWKRDAVSADWFSNINDAITAARNTGDGGIVTLSKDTTYSTNGQPLLVSSGLKIIGESARSSRISVDAEAAVKVAALSTRTEFVTIRDLTINGSGSTPVGMDLRGFYKSHIENFFITGCEVGLWVGGVVTQYHSCWSNYVVNGKIDTTDAGTGVRFSGTVNGGGSGAATANNNF